MLTRPTPEAQELLFVLLERQTERDQPQTRPGSHGPGQHEEALENTECAVGGCDQSPRVLANVGSDPSSRLSRQRTQINWSDLR